MRPAGAWRRPSASHTQQTRRPFLGECSDGLALFIEYHLRPVRKISVRGASGSGKSTLACAIADKLGVRFIDLDDLFWLPEWVGRSDEEFFAEVRRATEADIWVLAGNYTRIQDSLKDQIDTVIWLDYPKPLVM